LQGSDKTFIIDFREGKTRKLTTALNGLFALTRSLPVYECIILRKQASSRYFRTTLQLHNMPVDCAKELFTPAKDLASLLVCKEKI